jgi:hypothetical protein
MYRNVELGYTITACMRCHSKGNDGPKEWSNPLTITQLPIDCSILTNVLNPYSQQIIFIPTTSPKNIIMTA